MEESRVLLWHRDKLKLTIITDSFLQAVFDHILGRDVVKKLMQVSFLGSYSFRELVCFGIGWHSVCSGFIYVPNF